MFRERSLPPDVTSPSAHRDSRPFMRTCGSAATGGQKCVCFYSLLHHNYPADLGVVWLCNDGNTKPISKLTYLLPPAAQSHAITHTHTLLHTFLWGQQPRGLIEVPFQSGVQNYLNKALAALNLLNHPGSGCYHPEDGGLIWYALRRHRSHASIT